jgi:hypothetical protein
VLTTRSCLSGERYQSTAATSSSANQVTRLASVIWEAIDEPIVGRVYQDCHLWRYLRWLDDFDLSTKSFLMPVVSQIDAEPNNRR